MDISKRNLSRVANVSLSTNSGCFKNFSDKDILRLRIVVSEICSQIEHTASPILKDDYALYKHLLDVLDKEE